MQMTPQIIRKIYENQSKINTTSKGVPLSSLRGRQITKHARMEGMESDGMGKRLTLANDYND